MEAIVMQKGGPASGFCRYKGIVSVDLEEGTSARNDKVTKVRVVSDTFVFS
jgi:hypothetical protein